ncbi:efflux RND transporter periplasmic adaptor subunit [Thalassotalea maritima]|uniref:efflux RND transporter periplasmic adaptor subunit n=1 Tax=Thalassotalea maritima TaxID=3242416 RepID=UPI003526C4C6
MKLSDTSSQDVVVERKPKHKQRLLIAGSCLLFLLLAFYVLSPAVAKWSQADRSIPLERVRLATIEHGDFTRDVSVQGRVVAAVSPTLYAPAEGSITFTIDAGSEVAQGDILAHIDSPELTSRYDQEKAQLENLQAGLQRQIIQGKKQQLMDKKAVDLAQVTLTTARREKRRADQAYEKHAISQIDFEKAQDDLANAQLQYDHAVSDAKLAKESMDFELQSLRLDIQRQALFVKDLERQVDALTVTSPVNGIVGNLNVENKTYLVKNQPILMVVDLSQFEVEVAVPESYADDLLLGMDVEIIFAQQPYRARLVTISPEILDNQVTGRVRFEQHMPQGLRQNQRLNTRILLEHRQQVLQVRRGQFLDSSNGRFAYVVKDGIASKRSIQTGARSLSKVEIIDGLDVGETIVISGTDIFENAERVMLTQ